MELIDTTEDLRTVLRRGPYAWPGGYPVFLSTRDGGTLHFKCVRSEIRQVYDSMRRDVSDGWRVDAAGINWEDAHLRCDHCNENIESAYGETEEETQNA